MSIIIGIDPGKHTGFAVVRAGKLERCETGLIHEAMTAVANLRQWITVVRVEDARLRTWFPEDSGPEKWQGAGSIKRDCIIWEDYLSALKVPFEMVKPTAGATKLDAKTFNMAYGWTGSTSNHARDAGVLALSYRGMK